MLELLYTRIHTRFNLKKKNFSVLKYPWNDPLVGEYVKLLLTKLRVFILFINYTYVQITKIVYEIITKNADKISTFDFVGDSVFSNVSAHY